MEQITNFPKSKGINTLHKFTTEFNADSVEWCPHEPHKNFFVCGSYELAEGEENSTEKRIGCILLFSIDPEIGLKLHQKIYTAGVLDQKWCPNRIHNNSLLGVVNSNGKLEIYFLENDCLKLVTGHTFLSDEEVLILSLDWSTGKYESDKPHIVCSDSAGNIHLLQVLDNKLVLENSWHGHKFQAWITGFYYWDHNFIFSGGDDAVFSMFDKRIDKDPIVKNKQHEAGVTSLHSNKSKEFVVATGSYDEYIRLWDMRNIKRPTEAYKMPGTLWRLKWDPFMQKYLLAACMLGGIHVVDASQSEGMTIVESYYEHKNISYGADWSFIDNSEVDKFSHDGNVIIGTCSFYDRLLCISKTKFDF